MLSFDPIEREDALTVYNHFNNIKGGNYFTEVDSGNRTSVVE